MYIMCRSSACSGKGNAELHLTNFMATETSCLGNVGKQSSPALRVTGNGWKLTGACHLLPNRGNDLLFRHWSGVCAREKLQKHHNSKHLMELSHNRNKEYKFMNPIIYYLPCIASLITDRR